MYKVATLIIRCKYWQLMLSGLIFIFVSCTNNKAKYNSAKKDSIEEYLKLAQNEALPLNYRKDCNYKVLSLIDTTKNDSLVRYYLHNVSIGLSVLGDAKYMSVSNAFFNKAKEAKDTLSIARFYRYRAGYHRINTKRFDSSFFYYAEAEKFYRLTNDKLGLSKMLFYKAFCQYSIDDYEGAELSINKSYLLTKDNENNARHNYTVLTLMGNIAHNLKEYSKAIKFHQTAYELAKKFKLSIKANKYNFIATSLNNIGNAYKEKKEYEIAINYFKKGIGDKKNIKYDSIGYAYLYTNLGYSELQLENYKHLPKLFEDAILIFNKYKINDECAISHIYLSKYYSQIGNSLEAIKHSQSALKLSGDNKTPEYHLIALNQAGSVNKEKAQVYIKEYQRISDSLQFEKRKARSQFYKIQLETDEIKAEKDKAIQQKWLYGSVILAILLIVILLFIIYRQSVIKKQLQLSHIQQNAFEEGYKLLLNEQAKINEASQTEKMRITSSLHNGVLKKITQTRLQLMKVLNEKSTNNHFVKDLTWINEIQIIENDLRNLSHTLNGNMSSNSMNYEMLINQLFVPYPNLVHVIHNDRIDWEFVGNETKMHFYRLIREILNHSRATSVGIHFSKSGNYIVLKITDLKILYQKSNPFLKDIQDQVLVLNGKFVHTISAEKTLLFISLPV